MTFLNSLLHCHLRESGRPGHAAKRSPWMPALAAMTRKVAFALLAIAGLSSAAFASALDDNLTNALRDAYALPGAELTLSVQLDAPVPVELAAFADNARLANVALDKTSGRFVPPTSCRRSWCRRTSWFPWSMRSVRSISPRAAARSPTAAPAP